MAVARYRMICLVLLLYEVPICLAPPYLRHCLVLFVVAEGWLLLGIGFLSCSLFNWEDMCQQANIVGRKIVAQSGIEPAVSKS